jgi:hypothetical protein
MIVIRTYIPELRSSRSLPETIVEKKNEKKADKNPKPEEEIVYGDVQRI